MESILNGEIENGKKREFPRLMIFGNGNMEKVVLFIDKKCGTVVNCKSGSAYRLGYYSEDWSIELWEDFEGNVVLKS